MTFTQIRQQFLNFFASKDHAVVDSSPVVPHDDPTLLFTNAGMNQFKDVFLGSGSRPYARAADTQKCIRAGGKHNDLDDVGKDTYHHTFFEMLGNWSFGDYFKEDAIKWAWELLTEVWGIEKDRLYATYFEGDPELGLEPDLEAAELWKKLTDIEPANVIPGDKKDNFWEMGATGPCGPCSEIHVDLTPDKSGGSRVNQDDPSVIEIWNLVFIQFNRVADGTLHPLPAKHVDTGMGFERICAVLQGKKSNYDTDVFTPVFDAIQKRTGAAAYGGVLEADVKDQSNKRDALMRDVSYRVIADHLRCLTFALTDGAVPSNEGRGYVLRRILRRAVRYGRQYFDMTEPFLCDLVGPLADHMGDAFPELRTANQGKNVEHVAELIRDEEVSFGRTLDRGILLFNDALRSAIDRVRVPRAVRHGDKSLDAKAELDAAVEKWNQNRSTKRVGNPVISGEDAFKLHDTYGFPVDLTELMAEERGMSVDTDGYERLMDEARAKAQASGGGDDAFNMNIIDTLPATDDSAKYTETTSRGQLLGYVCDGQFTDEGEVPLGETVALVTDATCFYGEQGGQVGDRGDMEATGESPGAFDVPGFRVNDTKRFGETVLHIGELVSSEFPLVVGTTLKMRVDVDDRTEIVRNHTATHLLNWALREVLGSGVDQRGSLVDTEKTRFDFTSRKPVAADELERIGKLVEEKISAALPVHTKEVAESDARKINTLRAVFGEKYPEHVRVVSIGADIDAMLGSPDDAQWMQYSVEYCGGTHIQTTSDIEHFVLTGEEGVAKGIRRVVGITGALAAQAVRDGDALSKELETIAKKIESDESVDLADMQQRLTDSVIPIATKHALREQLTRLQKRLKKSAKASSAASADAVFSIVDELVSNADTLNDIAVVVGEVPSAGGDALRTAIDRVRQKTSGSAVLLATHEDGKVTLMAGMSKSAIAAGIKAGDLIREIAPHVGGKGGGRPDMAQGGGGNPDGIAQAITAANDWLRTKLNA
ncbi:MAG: alanine--tRNA ligase [Phycisphaerae bacterium]|nr:MAG: alanine--tRNA ligase [Phycisphaerae bacterium]